MRKILSKKSFLASLLLALMFVCTAFGMAGCKKDKGDTSSAPESSSSESSVAETTYTLSFETNGGTPVPSVTVKEGETVLLSDYVTEKENNYFYGWTLDEAFQIRAENSFVVESDVKLYAQWGADEMYPLSFETNGGSKIDSVLYRPNAYLVAPADPTKANYAFGGWYKDAACTKEFSFFADPQMPKKALTIYAKWNPLNAIVFETNGGSTIETVYGLVGDPVKVSEPTKDGYIFEGWYADAGFKTAYEVSMIPSGVVTVYAKWHEQIKNIQVTLHVNYGDMNSTATVTANEGEVLTASEAIDGFTASINTALKDSYLGAEADLAAKPVFLFSEWAYDEEGSNRFEGKMPHVDSLDLYAVWTRSAAYCQITFVEEAAETVYYVQKNTVVDGTVLDKHTASAKATYEQLGCTVEGFYTTSGNRYVAGDSIAMDMRLLPYVYSSDLVYEYLTVPSVAGTAVSGYVLSGYSADKAAEYKAKDELLLLIPEYYNDGTNGQQPVLWIKDSAFEGYNVNSVTLPNGLLGIGGKAFGNTKLNKITLPASVYYLGDNAFSGSASLSEVVFEGDVSNVGATIFSGTAYEATMPRNDDGFIFFDSQRSIIYGYEGTATTATIPSTARTIGGGAFKNNATIKKLTISDGVRYVSDYAFEDSVLEEVTVGKFFANMGVGIFKNCTKLVKVNFTSKYNLSVIGVSMFEGCTALTTINVDELANLTLVESRGFYGCSSLQYLSFSDMFVQVNESAFENCTSLISAEFGTSDESKLSKIDNRAFAGCTSLRRVILRGDLINNAIVSFGTNVFVGAGYEKNGNFVTPVLYVKDKTVDNWRGDDDDNKIYSYVEIYLMRLPTEYRSMTVKAIDSKNPDVTVAGGVEIAANAQFDLLGYLTEQGVYTVTDDVSETKDCLVYITEVTYQNGNKLPATDGKYNLSAKGAYVAVLVAEDEFGNKGEAVVHLNVV